MKTTGINKLLGGLNSDDNDRDLPDGDYRMIRNAENGFTSEDNNGLVASLAGTKLIPGQLVVISGIFYRCLGSCEDVDNNAIIDIIYTNFESVAIIRRTFVDTDEYEILLSTPEAQINTNRITHMNVVDGMLLWCQKETFPKKININKAKRFIESTGTDPLGYPLIDKQTIAAGAYPPNFKPSAKFVTIENYFSNFVNKNLYQFCYYYVYDDNEISQPGPVSSLVAPSGTWNYLGGIRSEDNFDNAIRLVYNTGHHKVKKIVFAYRTSLAQPWQVFTDVDKEGDDLLDFQEAVIFFYGNEATRPFPIELRNYDYVPITADTQEMLPGNKIAYGNYEAGIDKPNPDVSIVPELSRTSILSAFAISIQDSIQSSNDPQRIYRSRKNIADVWFSAVPPVNTNIRIRVIASWQIRTTGNNGVQYIYNSSYYREQEDQTYLRKSAGPLVIGGQGFPVLDYVYQVTPADVSGGLAVFVGNIRDAIQAVFDDYISDNITLRNAWNAWNTESSGFPLILPSEFIDATIESGVYADVSEDYETPVNVMAFPETALITGSHYVRLPGCVFLYDIHEKYPQEVDPVSYDSMFAGIIGGYYVYDLKQQFSPFYEGDALRSLKSGAFHTFGINYYDEMNRDSTIVSNQKVAENNGFKVYVKFPYELSVDEFNLIGSGAFKWVVRATINHRPPMGATHYKWVWFGNTIQSLGWFTIKAVVDDSQIESDRIKITVLRHPGNSSTGGEIKHTISVGDILRPVIKDSDLTEDIYFDVPLEVTVLAIGDIDVNGDSVIYVENFNYTTYGLIENSIVEIYTPKLILEEDESLFYEIGAEFPIIAPNTPFRAHNGSVQSQTTTLSQPAISIIDFGDVWVRQRKYVNGNISYVEDKNFSDYFPSGMSDIGRPAIIDSDAKRKRYQNQIVHGGSYFADTKVNDIFSISPSSVRAMGIDFGEITAMALSGYVLVVIQKHKVNSVYIGRTTASNSDGTDNELQLIDGTFGSINPSEDPWGCSNPESVCKSGRHIYFFDLNNGVWVRKAANGMFPISTYKYNSYWQKKADEIKALPVGSVSIMSEFNQRHNYLLTSIVRDGVPGDPVNDSVIFLEKENRWKVHLDIAPEHIGRIGRNLYSYIGEKVWKHDSGPANIFYGTRLIPEVIGVVKSNAWTEKVFDYMSLHSSKPWHVYELLIPKEYSASKRDMVSRIKAINFERSESTYNAEVRNDINTPGFNSEVAALNNGDTMRGKCIIVKMRFEEEDTVELYAFTVQEETSMKTP